MRLDEDAHLRKVAADAVRAKQNADNVTFFDYDGSSKSLMQNAKAVLRPRDVRSNIRAARKAIIDTKRNYYKAGNQNYGAYVAAQQAELAKQREQFKKSGVPNLTDPSQIMGKVYLPFGQAVARNTSINKTLTSLGQSPLVNEDPHTKHELEHHRQFMTAKKLYGRTGVHQLAQKVKSVDPTLSPEEQQKKYFANPFEYYANDAGLGKQRSAKENENLVRQTMEKNYKGPKVSFTPEEGYKRNMDITTASQNGSDSVKRVVSGNDVPDSVKNKLK